MTLRDHIQVIIDDTERKGYSAEYFKRALGWPSCTDCELLQRSKDLINKRNVVGIVRMWIKRKVLTLEEVVVYYNDRDNLGFSEQDVQLAQWTFNQAQSSS